MGLDGTGWDWILLRSLVQLEHLAVLKIEKKGVFMTLGKEKDKHSYISFNIDIEIYFDINTETCKIRQICSDCEHLRKA